MTAKPQAQFRAPEPLPIIVRPVLGACIFVFLTGCGLSVPQYSDRPATGHAAPQPVLAGVTARFAESLSADVSTRIANHCAGRGYVVLARSDRSVLCGKVLKPEESVVAAMYAGDKLSSEPEYRVEFALTAAGTDTRVRAQHWIEVKAFYGSRRRIGGLDESDPRTNLTVFLREIGGEPEAL